MSPSGVSFQGAPHAPPPPSLRPQMGVQRSPPPPPPVGSLTGLHETSSETGSHKPTSSFLPECSGFRPMLQDPWGVGGNRVRKGPFSSYTFHGDWGC